MFNRLFSFLIPFLWLGFAEGDPAGGGGGKGSDNTGNDPDADDDDADDKDGKDKDGDNTDDKKAPNLQDLIKIPAFKQQLEEWGNTFVQDRLDRDRKKRDKDQDKKRQDDLEQQKEFEKLSQERATKITELEADVEARDEQIEDLTGQIEAANEALSAYVDKLKDGVDPAVGELLEGKPLPEQLAWLAKHQNSENDGDQKQKGRIPETPKPGKQDEAAKKQRREDAKEKTKRRYQKTF